MALLPNGLTVYLQPAACRGLPVEEEVMPETQHAIGSLVAIAPPMSSKQRLTHRFLPLRHSGSTIFTPAVRQTHGVEGSEAHLEQ